MIECFEHFENWPVALGAFYRAILDSILLSLVFFKKHLVNFEKQKFSDHAEIFFCFRIHKKLNKNCSLEKKFCSWKKKVGSKKTIYFSFFSKGHIFGISILVSSVLLSCYHHLKAKLGNVFLPIHLWVFSNGVTKI